MKFIIQRVTEASVTVDGSVIGSIGKGFFVLIGVTDSDTTDISSRQEHQIMQRGSMIISWRNAARVTLRWKLEALGRI